MPENVLGYSHPYLPNEGKFKKEKVHLPVLIACIPQGIAQKLKKVYHLTFFINQLSVFSNTHFQKENKLSKLRRKP